jgi:hypothetical protein
MISVMSVDTLAYEEKDHFGLLVQLVHRRPPGSPTASIQAHFILSCTNQGTLHILAHHIRQVSFRPSSLPFYTLTLTSLSSFTSPARDEDLTCSFTVRLHLRNLTCCCSKEISGDNALMPTQHLLSTYNQSCLPQVLHIFLDDMARLLSSRGAGGYRN